MPIVDGRKAVAAAGTAEQLSAGSVGVQSVTLTAAPGNTGVVAIGGETVSAVAGAERGVILAAGQTVQFDARLDAISDLAGLWVDVTVDGDAVSYIAGTV